MKFTHTFFALCFLTIATTTMTAMQPSSTGILREPTFNNPARNINNKTLVTINRTPSERYYLKDHAYVQSLIDNNKKIKANQSKNARELIIAKYIKKDVVEDTAGYIQEEIELALSMNKTEEEARNKRRNAKVANKKLHREYAAAMTQESNFYDHATVDLLRVGLAVGCLYLVSGYFQNKK